MMMHRITLTITALLISLMVTAQHDERYVPETDTLVLKKLEQWKDFKFGLLMHWGAYSQWGIVESWSICPEDYGWTQRKKEGTPGTYNEYVTAYENLKTTFNPVKFDPTKWAKAARNAGMKYLVFTTKHHDGFCMFDSKYTDYKITDKDCAFSENKKANVTKEIFDAFRKEGLWAGAYFSKPDWHNDDYWWPYFPPKDRNVNYDPLVYPDKWKSYVDYTHNQILELMTDYGKVDILWLDGGWVAKTSKEEYQKFYTQKMTETESGYLKHGNVNQDINMDELVEKARVKQPGLIVVDRAVYGKNQNYMTPENRVPDKELPYPWESCIIAGGGWSYTADAQYMSSHKAIQMLIDIVCKGGNLLYNIGPGPDGTWHEDAYKLLEEMGDWMDVNAEAIYETRAIAPYKESKVCYTNKKNTNTVYAIYMPDENETKIPAMISVGSFEPESGSKVYLLGNDTPLTWKKNGNGCIIEVPESLQNKPPCNNAWSFKIEKIKR